MFIFGTLNTKSRLPSTSITFREKADISTVDLFEWQVGDQNMYFF